MLDNAITLAVLISGGFYMAFQKMPRNIRRWIIKHNLLIDVLCMLVTYWTLGGTVTALIAGALVDIMISAMLHVAEHPEDFVWLFDLMQKAKDAFKQLSEKLQQWNEEYKRRNPDAGKSTPKTLFEEEISKTPSATEIPAVAV